MGEPRRPSGPTRRQLLAGGLGVLASAATGGALSQALRQFSREDLIPGSAPEIRLQADRWVTTADSVSFAVIGDSGSGGRQAMAVAEQMARSYQDAPFGSVSLLGDISYYGPIDERFEDVFVKPFGPLIGAGVEFELAVGNHDGDLFFEEGVPDVEATLRLLGTPSRYYGVTRGPVDFFYLDTGQLLERDGNVQLEWLDSALTDATSRWRIVCQHHPIHSSGAHGPTPGLGDLEQVLVDHDVDLVLAGHDHHYERTVPIRGVTHVVSGGGCKLTPVHPSDITAFAESTLQFLRIDVNGDRLATRCVGVDGEVIDRFELTARRRS